MSQIKRFTVKRYTFRLTNSAFFPSLLPFSEGVCSSRKEFAPLGANSFLEEWTHLEELGLSEKHTGICVIPTSKTHEKHASQCNIIFEKDTGDVY